MIIKGGKVYSMAGINGDVCDIQVKDGIITKIEDSIIPDCDEEVINAFGKYVFPGFVDVHSMVGVNSQVYRFEKQDANEEAAPLCPQFRAVDALDFDDEGFSMARESGITSVVTGPGNSNLIGGTCCAVKTAGEIYSSRIIKDELCYHFVLTNEPRAVYGGRGKSPKTRMGSAALIREALQQAYDYDQKKAADAEVPFDLKLSSLARVFHGMPVKISAYQQNDIRTAIRIGEEFGLNYLITYAYDAVDMEQELLEHKAGIITGPLYGRNFKAELKGKDINNVPFYEKTEIPHCMMTAHPQVNGAVASAYMALLHKYGMSEEKVLKAFTIDAAAMLGLSDRVGSLETGKDADIVLWTGHPLDYYSSPAAIYINGIRI